jgi:hypothetical protein
MNPPDTTMIDGRTIARAGGGYAKSAAGSSTPGKPPVRSSLFDLKHDSRPAWEHNAAPSLLAWLQVYGSCSGSTQPHL